MKKYVTIGRDVRCDITLSDPTDQTSRNHALLEVDNWGRYHITDRSANGTYINGMKIPFGEPVKVSRKDAVSFAHIADLDWALVPKNNLRCYLIAAAVAVCLIVAGVFIFGEGESEISLGQYTGGNTSDNTVKIEVKDPVDKPKTPDIKNEQPAKKPSDPIIDAIY